MTLSHTRIIAVLLATSALAGCLKDFDLDMRGNIGGKFDTSEAARRAASGQPQPAAETAQAADPNGLIAYADYRAAVARESDTVATLANRVGVDPQVLARNNNLLVSSPLAEGQVLEIPQGAQIGSIDLASLAGSAIDRADPTPPRVSEAPLAGAAPGATPVQVRHTVQANETVYSIARSYGLSPRALADANGLNSQFTIHVGQVLLVPATAAVATRPASSSLPGQGSATPVPPSAATALPSDAAPAAQAPAAQTKAPDIGQAAVRSTSGMVMPVQGSIIREYSKGKNDGIDIGAPAGTSVVAAADGTVASVTKNTQNVNILVVRNSDGKLAIYTHLDNLTVGKGDSVTRGKPIGKVRAGSPSFVHFELRDGFESLDPMEYLR